MGAAGEALGSHAAAESAARTELDRVRSDRAGLQLRDGRLASEVEATGRERARLVEGRAAAETEATAARDILAEAVPVSPADLEEELAGIGADLAAAAMGAAGAAGGPAPACPTWMRPQSDGSRPRGRRSLRASRRRAADAERHAAEEAARASTASGNAEAAATERAGAAAALERARTEDGAAREAREGAQSALGEDEVVREGRSGGRSRRPSDRERPGGTARRRAARPGGIRGEWLQPRRPCSRRSLDRRWADHRPGAAARPSMRRSPDSGGRRCCRGRRSRPSPPSAASPSQAEAIEATAAGTSAAAPTRSAGDRLVEQARARGGGPLRDAVRRDDAGAAKRAARAGGLAAYGASVPRDAGRAATGLARRRPRRLPRGRRARDVGAARGAGPAPPGRRRPTCRGGSRCWRNRRHRHGHRGSRGRGRLQAPGHRFRAPGSAKASPRPPPAGGGGSTGPRRACRIVEPRGRVAGGPGRALPGGGRTPPCRDPEGACRMRPRIGSRRASAERPETDNAAERRRADLRERRDAVAAALEHAARRAEHVRAASRPGGGRAWRSPSGSSPRPHAPLAELAEREARLDPRSRGRRGRSWPTRRARRCRGGGGPRHRHPRRRRGAGAAPGCRSGGVRRAGAGPDQRRACSTRGT